MEYEIFDPIVMYEYLSSNSLGKARDYIKSCGGISFDNRTRQWEVRSVTFAGHSVKIGSYISLLRAIKEYNIHVSYYFGKYARIKLIDL